MRRFRKEMRTPVSKFRNASASRPHKISCRPKTTTPRRTSARRCRQVKVRPRKRISELYSTYSRYCWIRVVRSPARPCLSMACCQATNSSLVSLYRSQAASIVSRPPRTAATTSAFLRITQRWVLTGGRSAKVNGAPVGPITYCSPLLFRRCCCNMAFKPSHHQ